MFDNFHAIEEGKAYRSAQLEPETLEWVIRHYGVRTVINLRGSNPDSGWYQREKAVCERDGIRQVDVSLSASHLPTPEQLLTLYDAFHNEPQPVLMHCSGGADRSGMAAALWRITMRGETAGDAASELSFKYGHLRMRHPQMLQMVELFDARREWITQEYPRIFRKLEATGKPAATRKEDE